MTYTTGGFPTDCIQNLAPPEHPEAFLLVPTTPQTTGITLTQDPAAAG